MYQTFLTPSKTDLKDNTQESVTKLRRGSLPAMSETITTKFQTNQKILKVPQYTEMKNLTALGL